jgi:hypothetical protein
VSTANEPARAKGVKIGMKAAEAARLMLGWSREELPGAGSIDASASLGGQARSKRSRFITFVHAATKSRTNFSRASELP